MNWESNTGAQRPAVPCFAEKLREAADQIDREVALRGEHVCVHGVPLDHNCNACSDNGTDPRPREGERRG